MSDKISGYRTLSEAEVAAINELKLWGNRLLADANTNLQEGADARWTSIGITHIQQGVMALVRAIAKPVGV